MKKTAIRTSQVVHTSTTTMSRNSNTELHLKPMRVLHARVYIKSTEAPLLFSIDNSDTVNLTI